MSLLPLSNALATSKQYLFKVLIYGSEAPSPGFRSTICSTSFSHQSFVSMFLCECYVLSYLAVVPLSSSACSMLFSSFCVASCLRGHFRFTGKWVQRRTKTNVINVRDSFIVINLFPIKRIR